MAIIGLRDFYAAKMINSSLENGEPDGAFETYEKPKRFAKGIKADLSVEVAEGILYADDAVDEVVREFVKGSLKLAINDLPLKSQAELLGQTLGEDGIIFAGEDDDPPYFAIGFRAKKTGGVYRYVWLYKAKFKIPNESYETKSGGIAFKTPELEAQFIKRSKDGLWKADYVGKDDEPTAQKWFDEVVEKA